MTTGDQADGIAPKTRTGRHGAFALFASAGVFAGALAGLPAPAAAQEVTFSIRQTEDCLRGAANFEARRNCVGTSAVACMDVSEIGYSTIGTSLCIDAELKWWDARLNAAYKSLLRSDTSEDADFPPPAGVAGQAETLRQMQRAWIPFRDATCAYEAAQWTGGSGAGPAHVDCMMQMTGDQALYLEAAQAQG